MVLLDLISPTQDNIFAKKNAENLSAILNNKYHK